MSSSDERGILCVGLVCLDIIVLAKEYPEEDTDQRVLEQRWHRGGNASNTSTVLSLLGEKVHCMATLADTHELSFFKCDFARYGINTDYCELKEGAQCPTSICIINAENGSRTILHGNKNLPELTCEEFKKVDLSKFRWIHFEGRPSVEEIKLMCRHVCEYNQNLGPDSAHRITVSVELEKKRPELVALMGEADYVFVSKEHASMRGFSNKEEVVEQLTKELRQGATLICPWSELGAVARTTSGETYTSPIFPPPDGVVDTLGAGDTFIGGAIHTLSNGGGLGEAVTYACKLAGAKCGITGFDGLKGIVL